MVGVVVQIDAWDPVAGAAVTLCAGNHNSPAVCHMNGQVFWPVIAQAPVLRYDLFDGDFSGQISAPSSSVSIAIEPWPNFGRYQIADARVRVWTGKPGDDWSLWTLRFDGRATEQPAIAKGIAPIDFAVDDSWLDHPVLATFAGTGDLEGELAQKGTVKPLAIGAPRFVPGVVIDTPNTIVQLSAYGAIEAVETAFDMVSRFATPYTDYPSLAALRAATVAPGAVATCLAAGLVRHGAPPDGQLSYHVQGDAAGDDGWARLPGQVIRRVAELAGGAGRISDTSLDALDAARPYPISIWAGEQVTARDLIQRIAASVNAVAGISWTNQLFVVPIGIGTPSLTLMADATALPIVGDTAQVAVGPPYWRTSIEAERTWQVHALSDIAFEAPLVPMGRYDPATTYREGNVVDLADGSTWLYIATTPSAGNAPPVGATENSWWDQQTPPLDVSDLPGTADILSRLDAAEDSAANSASAIEALSDDGVLTVAEKVQVLIPQDAALEAAWSTIQAIATNLGITTELTAATSARSAWQAYRNGLTPGWNSTAADTPVVRTTFRDKLSTYDYDLKDLQRAVNAKLQANIALGLNADGTVKPGKVLPGSLDPGMVVVNNVTTLPASGVAGQLYMTPDGKVYAWVGGKWVSSQAPVSVALTNDNLSVPSAVDGSSPDLSRASGQALVYLGVTDVTAAATFSAVASGCTGTVNTADNTPVNGKPRGWFQVTAMSADTATLTITATSTGVTTPKVFSLSKNKQGLAGAPGKDGASAFTLAEVSSGNLTLTPTTVTKTAGGNAWNATLTTVQGFAGGAYASFSPGQATANFLMGLNTDPFADTDGSAIDYAFHFYSNGTWAINESGVAASGVGGSYTAADIFQVLYDNSQVIYRKNGAVVRTVTGVGSGLFFYLDGALYNTGTVVDSIAFGSIGAVGASASTLTLNATAPAFLFDGTGAAAPANQAIVLTANLQNISTPASWAAAAYDANGASLGSVTLGGSTANVRTLSLSNFGAAARVVVTASVGGLSDTTTILRLQSGSNALQPYLTNENASIPAAADGSVADGALNAAAGSFKVFLGSVEVTANCTFAVTAQSGCTAAITSAGAYSVSAMTANAATATLHATYQGAVLEKVLTLSKSIAGAAGFNAPLLSLKPSALTFTFDGIGNQVPANQSVTVLSVLQNLAGTVAWTVRRTYPDGSTRAHPYTDNGDGSISIEPDSIGSALNVVVTASLGGLTDQVTLVRLSAGANGADGAPAIVADLTNENVNVAADKNGTVPTGGFGAAAGSFKLFKGLTDISTGNGVAYSVVNSAGVTIAIDASSGAYSVSAMSANTGSATLRATYAGKTYDQVFTIAKSLAGQDGKNGADASVLTLSATSQTFTFDGSGAASPTGQSITLTPKVQNLSGTKTWSATKYNAAGSSLGTANLTGTGSTRSLAVADFGAAASVVVTVTIGAFSDTVTIVRLQDGGDGEEGEDALACYLTNETTAVPAASDGTVTAAALATAGGAFKVFEGRTEVTSDCSFAVVASSGCTAAITSAGVYSVSAMSADAASIELHATYQGVTLDKVVSLTKSRAGPKGDKGDEGQDGVALSVLPPAVQVSAFNDGTLQPGALANAYGRLIVMAGGANVTSSCTFQVVATSNCAVTVDSTGKYTIGSVTGDAASAQLRAVYQGANYDQQLSIAKIRQGAAAYQKSQAFNAAVNSGTYSAFAALPMPTSSGMGLVISASGNYTVSSASGTMQAKLQYSFDGSTWTDVSGSEVTGDSANATEPGGIDTSGTIAAATIGSAASLQLRFIMRRSQGSATMTITGQISAYWSN